MRYTDAKLAVHFNISRKWVGYAAPGHWPSSVTSQRSRRPGGVTAAAPRGDTAKPKPHETKKETKPQPAVSPLFVE
ncbi:hypothetical protein AB0L13_44770 [Saccharopolyspora shandongensis]|uniref:hypothetical protein n=1 Tax=Saccharopolyspora shandongensis TaxID=418495 RepID=UPI0034188DCF